MKKIENFTNEYSLQKTLRFKLVPQGETLQRFREARLLEEDKLRAANYKIIKGYLDRYYKDFIASVLPSVRLDGVKEYADLYFASDKSDAQRKEMETREGNLRKQIAAALAKDERYKLLFKKEIIRELLPVYLTDSEELEIVRSFADFSTCFNGFFQNRENMFTDEAKATGIAHRCINDNLPRFLDNVRSFAKVYEGLQDEWEEIDATYSGLFGVSVRDMFSVDYFTFTLSQDGIDAYNQVIGGYTNEDKSKVKGLNEYINLHNQVAPREKRLPKLKPLHKQILSEGSTSSYIPETFENDQAVLDEINAFFDQREDAKTIDETLSDLQKCFVGLSDGDTAGVYVKNDLTLTELSVGTFGRWDAVRTAWEEEYDAARKVKETEKYMDDRRKALKNIPSFSLAKIDEYGSRKCAENHETTGAVAWLNAEMTAKVDVLKQAQTNATTLLSSPYAATKKLSQNGDAIEQLKTLLDAVKDLERLAGMLCGSGKEENKNEEFYGEFLPAYERLTEIDRLYDRVRNHVTKKPFSITDKIKLNFGIKRNLLNGWVDSKTDSSDNGTQYGGYLFRKKNAIDEYDYYLGISSNTKLFRYFIDVAEDDKSDYERLDYYQPKDQTIYGSAYKGERPYGAVKEDLIKAIREFLTTSTDLDVSRILTDTTTPAGCVKQLIRDFPDVAQRLFEFSEFQALNVTLIGDLQKTMEANTRLLGAQEIANREYSLFTDIMDDISTITATKVFRYFPVSQTEWDTKQDKMYLFKISNKDLSYADTYSANKRKSRGKENLHTMYFKALMSGEQSVFDIGTAKVFYRGKADLGYSEDVMKYGHHRAMLADKFDYPIIKDHRYTQDQFQLHLSVTLNDTAPLSAKEMQKLAGKKPFNEKVRQELKACEHNYVIGIDRGERNLLYISVVDEQGRIAEQLSLNEIVNEHKGTSYTTDYHALLDQKEKERMDARKNWSAIENIKDLKEGYISQVVHKICELVEKYDAVIAMEDLNFGFKSGRMKVEKSVYQKFEKMLTDKLNFYVKKTRDQDKPGGLFHAYQLTAVYSLDDAKSFKQNGFIFYVPAWLTSKIDPITGFADLMHPRYESVATARTFFEKFDRIGYSAENGWFEFAFDYDNFNGGVTDSRKAWTVCSFGERIRVFRNSKKNNEFDWERVNLTERFKELFAKYNIPLSADMKAAILAQTERDFFYCLTDCLKLTLQMRNSVPNGTEDYLISPVQGPDGTFYCSNDYEGETAPLPVDADANGAYNIARKAQMLIAKFKDTPDEELAKVKMAISNAEWLEFAQK